MKIALAQINPTLGDFENNKNKIIEYIHKAIERTCEIIVFPEAAIMGYHPVDLLERPSIVKQQMAAINAIEKVLPGNIVVVFGGISLSPHKNGKPFCNSAFVLQKGKKRKIFAKQLLPTYDVFDEGRHIEPGKVKDNVFKFKNRKILITICEDIWAWPNSHHGKRSPYRENPIKELKSKEIDLVLNLSASPFTTNKLKSRIAVCKSTALHLKAPVVYVNMVGAQDEVIYDGGSFVTSATGKVVAKAHHFTEDVLVYDTQLGRGFIQLQEKNKYENYRQALVLGIRDFLYKTGFKKAHLGLSGGVDSALVSCLLVDAIGPQNVTCIMLPGPYTSPLSLRLSAQLVKNLGVNDFNFSISEIYNQMNKEFSEEFDVKGFSIVQENLQARLRGISLMAFSNLNNSLLFNTSNKSEFAVGYTTLYGDMVGALCPIGDLTKTDVFGLANWYNHQHELIPKEIISRPPSAELRTQQKDTDTLPSYDLLDPAVKKIVEKFLPPSSVLEKKVLKSMMLSEFKRWQAPPILKVTNHAFGRGRRLPIAHKAIF
ncbi:MAG: NAD+ synthase [Bdellovibrionales bacterium]|nr:NAD+ synthase [Bdellovibrionales bacterium]